MGAAKIMPHPEVAYIQWILSVGVKKRNSLAWSSETPEFLVASAKTCVL